MSIFKTADAQKVMDGFDNFVSRVGLNNDNSLSAGFYTFNLMTRNRIQLEAAYRGSWIAGLVVDSVAEDMTRAGIDITTNEADEEIKDIQAAMVRKQIWSSLNNAIKWGRLYGGCLAVIDIEGQDLSTPLNVETIGEGQFRGLIVYDRWQLNPDLFRVISNGPNIGLPEFYQVVNNMAAMDPTAAPTMGMLNIHHSRVIRITGIDLPYYQAITEMMWGESVLERLWDRLIAFDTATMGAANLIERANNRTIGIENLREIIAAGGQAQQGLEAMFQMMRTFQTNEGLTILDKNDVFTSTSYTFTGLPETILQFGQQLAGACGVPLVRLFGQSPAGLSATGEGDLRMYYNNITAQQENKLRDGLSKIIQVMWRSTFGQPQPKDLEFTFVSLWQMSATDKAAVAKTNTETILAAQTQGLVSTSSAMKDLRQMSGDTGLFSNISDQDIADAEEADALEEPPVPEADPKEEDKQDVVKNLDEKVTLTQRFKKAFGITNG